MVPSTPTITSGCPQKPIQLKTPYRIPPAATLCNDVLKPTILFQRFLLLITFIILRQELFVNK